LRIQLRSGPDSEGWRCADHALAVHNLVMDVCRQRLKAHFLIGGDTVLAEYVAQAANVVRQNS